MKNVGRYSRVSRRIWNDETVRALSKPQPCGQFLFIRLLTAPESTCIPGLFQAWESGLAESIGWTLKGFRESFAELSRNGLAYASWEHGIVWIPNAIIHNEPSNPNMVKAWAVVWAELPDCLIKSQAIDLLSVWASERGEDFLNAFLNGLPNRSINRLPNPIGNRDQDQDQEQEQNIKQEPFSELPRPPTGVPTAKKSLTVQPAKIQLSTDWQPTAARVDAICTKLGVTSEEILRHVPEFRLYWLPGGRGCVGAKALKRPQDWDQTFSHRIDQLVEYGKINAKSAQSSLFTTSPPTQPPTKPGPAPEPGQAWHRDGYWYYPLPKQEST